MLGAPTAAASTSSTQLHKLLGEVVEVTLQGLAAGVSLAACLDGGIDGGGGIFGCTALLLQGVGARFLGEGGGAGSEGCVLVCCCGEGGGCSSTLSCQVVQTNSDTLGSGGGGEESCMMMAVVNVVWWWLKGRGGGNSVQCTVWVLCVCVCRRK